MPSPEDGLRVPASLKGVNAITIAAYSGCLDYDMPDTAAGLAVQVTSQPACGDSAAAMFSLSVPYMRFVTISHIASTQNKDMRCTM